VISHSNFYKNLVSSGFTPEESTQRKEKEKKENERKGEEIKPHTL